MNDVDFNIILNRLKINEKKAWLEISVHIDIIVCHWAKLNKIELDWLANTTGVRETGIIKKELCSRFKEEFMSGNLQIVTYKDYKFAILGIAGEILRDQFASFYELMVTKNNHAWQRVNGQLHIYAAKWLSDKKIFGETATELFQDSLVILFEKVCAGKLHFESSKELKSYFFRILDLKNMEKRRKSIQRKQRSIEMEPKHVSGLEAEGGSEKDDKYYYIEKIMYSTSSEEEKYILEHYYFHGDKLTDIAKVLHISAGNCRQKKLQALRKIETLYQQIELHRNRM